MLDRFGELDTLYAQAKPWLLEREALKERIRRHCDAAALPADLGERLEGKLYYVTVTARENKRTVTDPGALFAALQKAMGLEKLASALSYTMKLVDAWIPKAMQAKFLKEERTGARDVTAVVISAPAA